MGRPASDVMERRFWAKVEKSDGCWLWQGYVGANGYGMSGKKPAHRRAYEFLRGTIPAGLELDHLCRTPRCVNPAHLEPVTHRTNLLRGVGPSAINAAKTRCVNGHDYDECNTYHRRNGQRDCRRCKAIRERERYRRQAKVRAA